MTLKPVALKFGTSGLRGLVLDMTDLECYINTVGYLRYLIDRKYLSPKESIAIAGDLRSSTDRIKFSIAKAIVDCGCCVHDLGKIPTPAMALFAMHSNQVSIMVTGSHIPDDRNGIKFYLKDREILKEDEAGIISEIYLVREKEYACLGGASLFNKEGQFKKKIFIHMKKLEKKAKIFYVKRYVDLFPERPLKGKKIVFDQHSAVGREIVPEILKKLGADVICEGYSEKFIPKDTENITDEDLLKFKELAQKHRPFAIVSTDGDSDRPFVVDENGEFYRGDILGVVAAKFLNVECGCFPISSNDIVVSQLKKRGVLCKVTKIGSPFVIKAMNEAITEGSRSVIGWEVNGGVLTGLSMKVGENILTALPTRDAVLPILCALIEACREGSVSKIFDELSGRFTSGGLLDDFPIEISQKIIVQFSDREDIAITQVDYSEEKIRLHWDDGQQTISSGESMLQYKRLRDNVESYFNNALGFDVVRSINFIDGVRIEFFNRDVCHLRPSGNAPQFRCYSNADSKKRAVEIVDDILGKVLPRIRDELK